MIKWASILAAAAGLSVAAYTVATAAYEPPPVPLTGAPSVNPYSTGIAGTGLVEAATRNIQVSAPEPGLVIKVLADVGATVRAGDPLFQLDARPLEADLARAQAALEVARASLSRREAEPRAETIPPLEAQIAAIEAELADWQDQYDRLREAGQRDGAAASELQRRYFAMEVAKARLAQAKSNLALARAGAWSADLDIARAELAQADAAVKATQALIERRTVRSPIDGAVLKRNVEPGQFAAADGQSAAFVVGDLSTLHVRARVDEEDLPLLRPGSQAVGRVRGRFSITVPLTMLRIEPLASPKADLSGATTERVDTRVLEVLLEVSGPTDPPVTLYPGQLLDVFIEGVEPGAPAGKAGTPALPRGRAQ